MEKNARYVLGGFVCLVAGGLMLFGAKNWRGRAFLLLLTFGGGLFALIFVRPIYLTPKAVLDSAPELSLNESESDPIALIREETGYYVIEDRLENLKGKDFHQGSG
jgi:hypothetical protein